MPRFLSALQPKKAAASRRKHLLPQAFCRHSIQHEGAPAPSYSPCETERFFSKQRFCDKLKAPEIFRGFGDRIYFFPCSAFMRFS